MDVVGWRRVGISAAVLALGSGLWGCGGAAPQGRLGTGQVATTTRPGTPAVVLNTTTTASSVLGVGPANGPASGSNPASGSGSGQVPGQLGGGQSGSGQPGGGSSGEDQDRQIAAMVDCLRSKGIDVPPPSTDSGGRVVYDEAALARLSQDPGVQAAVEQCSLQLSPRS